VIQCDLHADHLTVHYATSTTNLLRVAIPFYPGWHAAASGSSESSGFHELSLVAVDYALLGVVVPPGEGELRLWYAPRFLPIGAFISALALVGVIAAVAAGPLRAARPFRAARPLGTLRLLGPLRALRAARARRLRAQ
jgi:uncharacterized membrane protein YfhO